MIEALIGPVVGAAVVIAAVLTALYRTPGLATAPAPRRAAHDVRRTAA